jgi:hypothetical protein
MMNDDHPKTLAEMAAEADRVRSNGLACPTCDHHEWSVYYTRQKQDRVFRRRRCLNCGRLVSTMEMIR